MRRNITCQSINDLHGLRVYPYYLFKLERRKEGFYSIVYLVIYFMKTERYKHPLHTLLLGEDVKDYIKQATGYTLKIKPCPYGKHIRVTSE